MLFTNRVDWSKTGDAGTEMTHYFERLADDPMIAPSDRKWFRQLVADIEAKGK